jgi:hypothetical protein
MIGKERGIPARITMEDVVPPGRMGCHAPTGSLGCLVLIIAQKVSRDGWTPQTSLTLDGHTLFDPPWIPS